MLSGFFQLTAIAETLLPEWPAAPSSSRYTSSSSTASFSLMFRWMTFLMLLSSWARTAQASTLSNGLVAYYPFNGNANDSSGNNNDGVVHSATLTTDRFGNANSAYRFDGSSSYISVPGQNLNCPNHMTVAFWMNPNTIQRSFVRLMQKYVAPNLSGWLIDQPSTSTNNIRYNYVRAVGATVSSPSVFISPSVFSHVAFVKQDAIVKVYLNSVLISTSTAFASSNILSSGSEPLLIGVSQFNGTLDDIFIYNRTLSASEVTELYDFKPPTVQPTSQPTNQPSSRPTGQPTAHLPNTLKTGLVAYYPFDGNANDNSGNNNDGVVHSATLVADRFGNPNSAYSFDGSSSYIEISGGQFKFTNDLSISFWLRPTASQVAHAGVFHQVSADGGWFIEQWNSLAASNRYYFAYKLMPTGLSDPSFGVTDNNFQTAGNSWNFVVVTKQGTVVSYYLNGTLVNTITTSSAAIKANQNLPLLIGAENFGYTTPASGVNRYYNGYMDDIFIFNRTLSTAEITALYDFDAPTGQPTSQPSTKPSAQPSTQPTSPSSQPTRQPTVRPSGYPTRIPSGRPTSQPSLQPSGQPSMRPSRQPTGQPTIRPSTYPTRMPSDQPTRQPSAQPTRRPSSKPTNQPSSRPSRQPTVRPSSQPSKGPSSQPTPQPSGRPTRIPSGRPTSQPSLQPSGQPSVRPSRQPSGQPTMRPSTYPTRFPSAQPSSRPSRSPSSRPSRQPSAWPTTRPSGQPTRRPNGFPTVRPSGYPTSFPTPIPFNTVGYVNAKIQPLLANITAVMTQLALESTLRSHGDSDLVLSLSTETEQRLLNFSFAMTQLLLESQFRASNDTYLFQHFSNQINATYRELNENLLLTVAKLFKNSDAVAVVMNTLGSTLQSEIDTEIRDRTVQDNYLFQFITNTSVLAAYLSTELIKVNGSVSLIHRLLTNESEFTSHIFKEIRQELNATRANFNQNIAERMAEALQNTGTVSAVLESLGNTLKKLIDALEQRVSTLENENQALKSRVSTLEDEKQAVRGELGALKNQTFLLEEKNAALERQVNILENENQGLKSLFSTLQDEVRALINHTSSLIAQQNASIERVDRKATEATNSIKQDISDLGLSDGSDYKVPSEEVTNVITAKAAAIDALDDPLLQSIRRYLDLVLSIKEVALICIFIFNAVILIDGMSVTQSLLYLFALPKRRELDRLRQGKTGPTGSQFDTFVAHLEKLIIEGNFSSNERLEYLAKLSQIQRLKGDSIRLFSSKDSPSQMQSELNNLQQSCLVGMLRGAQDPFYSDITTKLYSHYLPWRRINIIRALIYSTLRPYTGSSVSNDNIALGRRETWESRMSLRERISDVWQSFCDAIPLPHLIMLPEPTRPEWLTIQMHNEIDQHGLLKFSEYINKMHSRMCLLSHIPSIIVDLYCLLDSGSQATLDKTIQTISEAYPTLTSDYLSRLFIQSKQLIKAFNAIMEDILKLYTTKSWIYSKIGMTRSLASLSKSEEAFRTRLARAISENFNDILKFIVTAIPLFSVWMTQYGLIAARYDLPLAKKIEDAKSRISRLTDHAEGLGQKHTRILQTLSTEDGLPGLIDLIDLCVYLDQHTSPSCLSISHNTDRRVHPEAMAPAETSSSGSETPIERIPSDQFGQVENGVRETQQTQRPSSSAFFGSINNFQFSGGYPPEHKTSLFSEKRTGEAVGEQDSARVGDELPSGGFCDLYRSFEKP